ncbi:MAG: MBL fold metallo-hydrolase [Streptosporangiaceae bacterium]
MPSSLTVLGSCGAWPEPGRACSGFLLEHDGSRIVLDLGYGTATRLLAALGSTAADGLDAVVVTHQHPDHMTDLHALLRARWFGRRGAPAMPLLAPEGVLAALIALEDGDRTAVHQVFRWQPIPAPPQQAGPFRLDSTPLPHSVPNAGVRLTAAGLTVAYTGDTGPSPALADLGRDADLYIMDATSRDQQPSAPVAPAGPPINLTAREAGQAAAAAGARRLLLTHFWPGNDRRASGADAAAAFGGEVLLAEEGLTIQLP